MFTKFYWYQHTCGKKNHGRIYNFLIFLNNIYIWIKSTVYCVKKNGGSKFNYNSFNNPFTDKNKNYSQLCSYLLDNQTIWSPAAVTILTSTHIYNNHGYKTSLKLYNENHNKKFLSSWRRNLTRIELQRMSSPRRNLIRIELQRMSCYEKLTMVYWRHMITLPWTN